MGSTASGAGQQLVHLVRIAVLGAQIADLAVEPVSKGEFPVAVPAGLVAVQDARSDQPDAIGLCSDQPLGQVRRRERSFAGVGTVQPQLVMITDGSKVARAGVPCTARRGLQRPVLRPANHGLSGAGNGGTVRIGLLEYRDVIGSIRYAKSRPDTVDMTTALLSVCLGCNRRSCGRQTPRKVRQHQGTACFTADIGARVHRARRRGQRH